MLYGRLNEVRTRKTYLDIPNVRTNGINYAWQPRGLMDILRGGLEPPPTPNGMYATFVGDGLPDVPDTRTKIKKLCVTKNAPRCFKTSGRKIFILSFRFIRMLCTRMSQSDLCYKSYRVQIRYPKYPMLLLLSKPTIPRRHTRHHRKHPRTVTEYPKRVNR